MHLPLEQMSSYQRQVIKIRCFLKKARTKKHLLQSDLAD